MNQPVRVFEADHLPSGLTIVYAYVGADRVYAFSLATKDYHNLTDADVRDAIRIALQEERPPLKVRRPA